MKNIILIVFLFLVAISIYVYSTKNSALDTKNSAYTTEVGSALKNSTAEDKSMTVDSSTAKFTGDKMIDTTKSTFTWTGKKVVLKNWIDSGTILAKSGTVSFKDGVLTDGEIVLDMNSIVAQKTGSGNGQEGLAKHLKSDAFFDVTKYPTAKFVVTKFENGVLLGDLTIKDTTKPISVPTKVLLKEGITSINGQLVVDRSMFNVKFGSSTFFDNLGDKAIDNIFTIDFSLITK